MVTGRIERLRGVAAVESIFGWLIQGSVSLMNVVTEAQEAGVMKVITEDDCQVSDQVHKFWETEALGIEPVTQSKNVSRGERSLTVLPRNSEGHWRNIKGTVTVA